MKNTHAKKKQQNYISEHMKSTSMRAPLSIIFVPHELIVNMARILMQRNKLCIRCIQQKESRRRMCCCSWIDTLYSFFFHLMASWALDEIYLSRIFLLITEIFIFETMWCVKYLNANKSLKWSAVFSLSLE